MCVTAPFPTAFHTSTAHGKTTARVKGRQTIATRRPPPCPAGALALSQHCALPSPQALRGNLTSSLETIIVPPRALTATFFSDGMPGLAPEVSKAVRDALVAAGHVDGGTFMVKQHPSRGAWRDAVRAAIEAATHKKNAALPQGSMQLTMDGVFARLDLAYAYHASTCAVMDRTLAFFERYHYPRGRLR